MSSICRTYENLGTLIDIHQIGDAINPRHSTYSTIVYNKTQLEIHGDIPLDSMEQVISYIINDLSLYNKYDLEGVTSLVDYLSIFKEEAVILGIIKVDATSMTILNPNNRDDYRQCIGFIYTSYAELKNKYPKQEDRSASMLIHSKRDMEEEIFKLNAIINESVYSVSVLSTPSDNTQIKPAIFYGHDIFRNGLYSYVANYDTTISEQIMNNFFGE